MTKEALGFFEIAKADAVLCEVQKVPFGFLVLVDAGAAPQPPASSSTSSSTPKIRVVDNS